jgi:mRNA-degrading endonuclease RelE of RelBE toxin-antitoxin system
MAQNTLELTEQAEGVYRSLWQKINASLDSRDTSSSAALDEIENLFERITRRPIREEWRLSGMLNYLFRVKGKWSRVCYRVLADSGAIIIVSITPEFVGSPDPKEVLALATDLLVSEQTVAENRRLQRLLGIQQPLYLSRSDGVH